MPITSNTSYREKTFSREEIVEILRKHAEKDDPSFFNAKYYCGFEYQDGCYYMGPRDLGSISLRSGDNPSDMRTFK